MNNFPFPYDDNCFTCKYCKSDKSKRLCFNKQCNSLKTIRAIVETFAFDDLEEEEKKDLLKNFYEAFSSLESLLEKEDEIEPIRKEDRRKRGI